MKNNLSLFLCMTLAVCTAPLHAMLTLYTTAPEQQPVQQILNAGSEGANEQERHKAHSELQDSVDQFLNALQPTPSTKIFKKIALLSAMTRTLRHYPGISFASAAAATGKPFQEYSMQLLYNVAMFDYPLIAQNLIASGACMHSRPTDSCLTPLEWAAYTGDTNITQMLLDAGVHEAFFQNGSTAQALRDAAHKERTDIVRLFLFDRVKRNYCKPLVLRGSEENYDNLLGFPDIHPYIHNAARFSGNVTTMHLFDCATTQPHKLAKLGYSVAVLPAQLPHILMMRERGVKYTGNRVRQVTTMRENNARQTGDRMGQAKRPKEDDQEEQSRKKIA